MICSHTDCMHKERDRSFILNSTQTAQDNHMGPLRFQTLNSMFQCTCCYYFKSLQIYLSKHTHCWLFESIGRESLGQGFETAETSLESIFIFLDWQHHFNVSTYIIHGSLLCILRLASPSFLLIFPQVANSCSLFFHSKINFLVWPAFLPKKYSFQSSLFFFNPQLLFHPIIF